MVAKFVSDRNLKFLLYEVFDVESLTQHEYYRNPNRKTFDLVLKAAIKLAQVLFYPIFTEMDREQPQWVNGEVKVHPSVKKIITDINFYNGKMFTLRYFFGYELPKAATLTKRLLESDGLTVEMKIEYFN